MPFSAVYTRIGIEKSEWKDAPPSEVKSGKKSFAKDFMPGAVKAVAAPPVSAANDLRPTGYHWIGDRGT